MNLYNVSMKNYQKAFSLIVFFLFSPLSLVCANVYQDPISVYIMLDVDGTLTQRIAPNDTETIAKVAAAGYHCYRLKFIASKFVDPKFYRWYMRMLTDKNLREKEKLNISIIDENSITVEEVVVVRPAIIAFLEKLDRLNSPSLSVKFYIASRNDDVRNQNLIDNLNISINGTPFKEKVKLIPRANFRVHVYLPNEGLVPGKSSALIRAKFRNEKFQPMEKDAYIMFIDNIVSERFVIGDIHLDRLLQPTRFTISNLNAVDIEKDQADFQAMFKAIEQLVSTPHSYKSP